MPVTVVVGGQYGSEGKGKVCYSLHQRKNFDLAVRVGGVNAGHTVIVKGEKKIFRQLPVTHGIIPSLLCSGSYLDLDILFSELGKNDLMVDPYAVVISNLDKLGERKIRECIGSTGSGIGHALSRRVMRESNLVFAKDVSELKKYLVDSSEVLNSYLSSNQRVLLEGSQGFGLSLLHSGHYPYATSRDTTASGFLSEAGISPFHVGEIVMVIRSYPIRVAGNSGPMTNEIQWDHIGDNVEEYTSVSRRLRRVSLFDPSIVKRAIRYNNPNIIVLNHLDYIPIDIREEFLEYVKESIGRDVDCVGLSPTGILNTHQFLEGNTEEY